MALTIYKSSAGSGKTFTLVREYVKLLIKDPRNYRHILAITFTNKATDEMKQRIVGALAQLASRDPKADSLAEVLLADPDLKPITDQHLRQQAANALSLVLHNYAEFSVSTIDSFFQQILRNFAKELKIPVRYEVELDTKAVIDALVMKLMLDVGHRKEITQWLEDFAFASLDDDKGWKIERQIIDLSEKIFQEDVWENIKLQVEKNEPANEKPTEKSNPKLLTNIGQIIAETTQQTDSLDSKPPITDTPNDNETATLDEEPHLTHEQKTAKLAAEKDLLMQAHYEKLRNLVKKLHATRRAFEAKMIQFGKEGIELIHGFGLKTSDFKNGTANYFDKISHKNMEPPGATLRKIYAGTTTEWRAKTSPLKNKIDQLVDSGLQDLLVDTIAFYDENLPNYYSAQEVSKNIYIYGLLHEIKDKLIDYRTENSKMLISDTNFILNSIIKGTSTDTFTQSDAPFIFEKVGLTYHHIMLDEFQDTSNYQWKNLLPLVQNTLSDQNRALVVGDVKQSIYRWRGGNMHLLLSGLQRDLKAFWQPDTEQELAHNYRSKYEIVRFNNSLFAAAVKVMNELPALHGSTDIEQAYATVEQQIKKGEGGFVQVRFLPNEQKGELKWRDIAEAETLELIANLRAKGIKLNQIAILTRRNQDGSAMAKLLGERRIKVISSESLLLNQSPKIRLLMSLLTFIADQRNTIARAEVLVNYVDIYNNWLVRQTPSEVPLPPPINAPLHQLYTDHLHPDQPNSLFNTLLPKNLIDNLSSLTKLALYEAVEEIIRHLKLHHEPDAYIQRFQDLVLEHTNKIGNDLGTFLVWWKQHQNQDKCSIIVPKGEDAITIMTIHKAKGLEFPVVIMPYADWSLKPKAGSVLWSKTDMPPYNNMGIIPLSIGDRLSQSHFSEPYQRELLDNYLDNMNLLYVALTRPTDRLYVFTPMYNPKSVAAKTGDLSSLHQLLYLSLKSPHYATIGCWTDDSTYTYGSNQNNDLSSAETDEVSPLTEYICNDYRQRITIKSEAQKFFMLFDNDRSVAIRIGQQVHAVLEKTQAKDDIPNIIRKLQLKGIVNQDDIPTIEQRLAQVFDLPEVQVWFGNNWDKVLCERVVMNNSRKKIPDRVMLKGKNAVIVDYKTGEKKDSYFKQLNDYAQILAGMGYQITEKYLLYIGEDGTDVVKVT